MLAIPLVTIAVVWAVDMVVFILSFTNWRNRPLQISQDGIAKGKGPILRYEDATAFSFRVGPPAQYSRMYWIFIIQYKNGASISFDYSEIILKTISGLCQDKTFMTKLNELVKQCHELKNH